MNSRQPTTPSSLGRVGSSSRPVRRSSAVDFDKVPSPKPRASYRPSTSKTSTPGPSNLSKSFVVEEEDDDDDSDDAGGGFDDYGPENNMPSPPGNASFAELNGDDEQEPEEEEPPEIESPPRRTNNKGKGRAEPEEEPEEEVEDEIAHGLEGLEVGQRSEEEDEPISKRARTEQAKVKKQPRAKPKPKPKPIQEERSRESFLSLQSNVHNLKQFTASPDGVRRSKRHRYAPLDWWRNEKVVYGRSNSGNSLVPTIREIRRLPQEPPKPLGKNKRKRSTAPRGKSTAANDDDVVVLNPEEGWDDTTSPELEVLNFETGEPEIRSEWICFLYRRYRSLTSQCTLSRTCVYLKDDGTQGVRGRWLVFWEDIPRWSIHRCWVYNYTSSWPQTLQVCES